MTAMLSSLARGRMVVCLEGGYNLRSISRSMEACARVLLGDGPLPTLMSNKPKPRMMQLPPVADNPAIHPAKEKPFPLATSPLKFPTAIEVCVAETIEAIEEVIIIT